MKRSIYLQPTAIFYDRTAARGPDEAEPALWRGLPLAGGRMSFAAVDILMRGTTGTGAPQTKRKTVEIGRAHV